MARIPAGPCHQKPDDDPGCSSPAYISITGPILKRRQPAGIKPDNLNTGDAGMYLKQSDLFWGMSHDAIQKIMDKTVKLEFNPGDTIFKADDTADHFYVLINGKVNMQLQNSGQHVYSSTKTGEIFGWSALIDRREYSATVICAEPTKVLQFDKNHVQDMLEQDSDCSANFYKQLACALGNRLMKVYDLLE